MIAEPRPLRIDIWHNILWSKYKGEVFSAIHHINDKAEFDIRFFQIAETEGNRVGLSKVDMRYHRYPFDLLFKGAIDRTGLFRRTLAILTRTLRTNADLAILSSYERPETWLQIFILRIKGCKTALFCDSTINDQKQGFLKGIAKRLIFRSVQGIFGYGMRSKEYVVHYGANPNCVFHRCQAAALSADYTVQRALNSRLELAPTIGKPRFLYIGRLAPEKGLDTLVEAFQILQNTCADASLTLVGSGPLLQKLEHRTRELGISSKVHFAGSKSDTALFEEYAKATALVLSSTSEPWGLVVNEALSYGCPAIVSDVCGCVPELVLEGKTGFVHKTNDPNDLAKKMLSATTQFSDIKRTANDCFGVIANYSPQKAAEQILTGCRTILHRLT